MTVIAKVAEYIKCDECGATYIQEADVRPGPLIRIWSCGMVGLRQRWLDFCSPDCCNRWVTRTHKPESEAT